MDHRIKERAQQLANLYSRLPEVESVVVGGSRSAGTEEFESDLDIYVYSRNAIPVGERRKIVPPDAEIDNQFWEPGDEWIDSVVNIGFDVMYRTTGWIESQIDRVLRLHQASVGYSTCFWHNVLTSFVLFDREGWYQHLQDKARQPYPKALVQAIIRKNHPILRKNQSSYLRQIEKAIQRKDLISVQHRVTALLASYFDILFAVNELPHPGEKRMLQWAEERCSRLPSRMSDHVTALIQSIAIADQSVVLCANNLIDGLDLLLNTLQR